MAEFATAVLAFLAMMSAVLLGLLTKKRSPSEDLQDQTKVIVTLVANLFVVMTSLVVGLMMNSAKNTYETNNRNVHALATQVILLDRIMRAIGPETVEARRHLVEYLEAGLREGNILEEDPHAEALLDAAGTSLRAIRVTDAQQIALWNDARQLYRQVVQQRWVLVDASGGTIPAPLIIMLILWLSVIFASFGYLAPRNTIVMASFLVAALLTSAALYLILDMDTPSSGLVRTSNLPFQRALAELQH